MDRKGTMGDPLFWHRLQFGFTATYHYLFPQLTMGLAFLIVVFKAMGLRSGEARTPTPRGSGSRSSASTSPWAW